jgi:hypothetical protein
MKHINYSEQQKKTSKSRNTKQPMKHINYSEQQTVQTINIQKYKTTNEAY